MLTPETAPRLLHVFRAGQISTPIKGAVCVQLNDDPDEAVRALVAGRFDQAPVLRQNHVVGWLKTDNLERRRNVKAVLKPLTESPIVSAAAPIADVLDRLGSQEFVFTVEDDVSGFVTPSDLDRHAARSHFYLLISAIEMLLAEIVRRTFTGEFLSSRIRGDAAEAWVSARARNAEADPTEYLFLQDLAELFLEAHSDTQAWTKQLSDRLTEICQFRPVVMHPTRSVAAGRTAAQLASLARGAGDVTQALTTIMCT